MRASLGLRKKPSGTRAEEPTVTTPRSKGVRTQMYFENGQRYFAETKNCEPDGATGVTNALVSIVLSAFTQGSP